MTVHFNNEQVKLMEKALDKWGEVSQIGMVVEECAELIVALQKYVNRTPKSETVDNVIDEIADVEIMLAALRVILGVDDETLQKRMEEKLGRLRAMFGGGE